jgi:hypothetical protein
MNHHLARLAVDVNWRHLALGHETVDAPGAPFVYAALGFQPAARGLQPEACSPQPEAC